MAYKGGNGDAGDEPVTSAKATASLPQAVTQEDGRLIEFYVITGQQLNELVNARIPPLSDPIKRQQLPQPIQQQGQQGPLVPPLNEPIDAVLNRSNRIANNHQEAICVYIEGLARNNGSVVEAVLTPDTMRLDLQRPLIVDSIPTKRPSGYYVRALGTPEYDEKDDIIFHDSLRVAQALLQTGMSRTLIQNTQVLDQLQENEQTQQERAEQTVVRSPDRYRGYRMNDWQTQRY